MYPIHHDNQQPTITQNFLAIRKKVHRRHGVRDCQRKWLHSNSGKAALNTQKCDSTRPNGCFYTLFEVPYKRTAVRYNELRPSSTEQMRNWTVQINTVNCEPECRTEGLLVPYFKVACQHLRRRPSKYHVSLQSIEPTAIFDLCIFGIVRMGYGRANIRFKCSKYH